MDNIGERFPPIPKILDYPGFTTALFGVLFTGILLLIATKWDPTQGPLTISLLVVLAFIGTVAFCLFFTIPNDEITSAVVGGLVASFGAVIAFWLGRPHPPK
jgi:drug/metabolite transporter (DMT)-like permease